MGSEMCIRDRCQWFGARRSKGRECAMAYPQALWESQATEKLNTARRAKNKYEMKQFKLGEIVTRCGMGPACVVFGCLVDPGFVLCYKNDGSNVQAAVVPGIDGQHDHIVFAYMDVMSLERSIHKAPTEVQSMYDRYLQGMNDTNELWAWKTEQAQLGSQCKRQGRPVEVQAEKQTGTQPNRYEWPTDVSSPASQS